MPSAMNGPTQSFPLVITSARGLTGRSVGHSSTQRSHRSDMGTAGSGKEQPRVLGNDEEPHIRAWSLGER